MKIVQLTTDNRNQHGRWDLETPYFGTAPEALLEGFSMLPEVEVHVVSCTSRLMRSPDKLAANVHFHSLHVPKAGWGRTLFAGCALATRRFIAGLQPDIVHGQGTERDCAMEAVYSGYPNVLTIHGNMRVHASRGENRGKLYYRLAAWLEAMALRRTDGVVSISSYTDSLVGSLARRSWILPNATTSSCFDAKPEPSTPPVLLFIGGLDERKNPIAFIRACGELVSEYRWKFRLCGSGDPDHAYVKELQELARANPWIELAGWKSREELFSELEQASALVLPTLEDNCPMVVLEAMAAGLPVIASKVGGVPDLITEGRTGLMFDPHDPESMRQATERIVGDPALRAALSAAASEEARNRFHPRVVAEAHLGIYREVLGMTDRAARAQR